MLFLNPISRHQNQTKGNKNYFLGWKGVPSHFRENLEGLECIKISEPLHKSTLKVFWYYLSTYKHLDLVFFNFSNLLRDPDHQEKIKNLNVRICTELYCLATKFEVFFIRRFASANLILLRKNMKVLCPIDNLYR